MFSTLALSAATWDLTLDSSGNIAVATESTAVAQDVASAVQTFQGECWFDTTVGLPYFTKILGQPVNQPLWEGLYNNIAETVPDVVSAQTSFTALGPDRKLSGTVKVIDTTGQTLNATF